jgi:RHS repeat-associated protein
MSLQYDLLGRVTESSRPVSDSDLSLQTTYTYHEGLTTRTVDPLEKQSAKVGNVAGLMARSIDHSGYFQHFDYDAFGNVYRVTDAAGNTLLSNTYNIRGMRTAMSDIAAGNSTYTPNALGEIIGQVDAKMQATTFEYDVLGRLTNRIEAEGQSVWTWGASADANNIGRLALVSGPGYAEGYEYDVAGRLVRTTISSDATYHIDYEYNTFGALGRLTYPTSTSGYRLKLQYEYDNGHLRHVYDYNDHSSVFWTGNDTDARGNILSETLGNAIQTIRGYDTVNGRLDYLQSYAGGVSVQDLNYVWNRVGTLAQRQDARQGITESFHYDDLHRLTSTTGPDPIGIAYDARGNITSMTGNVESGSAHTIDWYSYNLPSQITGAPGNSSTFYYGPDRARWKQVASIGGTSETTIYIGGLIEKVTTGGITSWRHTIAGGNGPVAMYTRKSNGTNEIHYLTRDHLGSVDSISNAAGGIEVRLSFGSFGQRRNENGWSGPVPAADSAQIANTTRRGFTVHEMLDNLDLIHMNGRVYDQHAGRFISPDPLIDGIGHTQGWNRYAYVKNAPSSFTDPTGFECYSTCLPKDGWNRFAEGSPLGSAGVRSYDFSGAFSEAGREGTRGVDRPGLYDLATNPALRQTNYENLRNAQAAAEVFRSAVLDRSGFMEQVGREYGYDTGAREHLNLPRHGTAPAPSAVGGIGASSAALAARALPRIADASFRLATLGAAEMSAIVSAPILLFVPDSNIGGASSARYSRDEITAMLTVAGGNSAASVQTMVHGNSLSSTRATHVYQLVSTRDGAVLKYGITSALDPMARYPAFFYSWGQFTMELLATYPTRAQARQDEVGRCTAYVAATGDLPPLSLVC